MKSMGEWEKFSDKGKCTNNECGVRHVGGERIVE